MNTTRSLSSTACQHSARKSTSPPRASLKKAGRLRKRVHRLAVLDASEMRADRLQFQAEGFDERPVGLRRAERDVVARMLQRAAEHAERLRIAARAEGEDRDAGGQICLVRSGGVC
jgi:hypothetical protein